MKCLVLGGKGFLGSHLCNELIAAGHSVRVFDRPASSVEIRNFSSMDILEGDFLNEHDINEAIEGVDVIYHLISTTVPKSSNDDPVFDVETNLVGSLNVLRTAVRHGVKKIIFTSSGGTVYGTPKQTPIREDHPTDPICSYGVTKLAIEKYLYLFHEMFGLDYCVLRISNPYGEGQRTNAVQGAVGVFAAHAVAGDSVEIWGDGSVIRDYLHVSDVSAAMLRALDYSGERKLFNIGSGKGQSLNDIVDMLGRILGHPVMCNYKAGRKVDVPISVLDNSLAKEKLGWIPKVSFYDGLERTVNSLVAK